MSYGPERLGVRSFIGGTSILLSAFMISGVITDQEAEVKNLALIEATPEMQKHAANTYLGSLATEQCSSDAPRTDNATCVDAAEEPSAEHAALRSETLELTLIHSRSRRRGTRRPPRQSTRSRRRYSGPVAPPAIPPHCEQYREFVQQYPWPADMAMLMIYTESGCDPNRVSRTNDYGLVQLHNEQVLDPATNIRRGYEKYANARRGSNNFSAFYAVCTPGNSPNPKYHGVPCQ